MPDATRAQLGGYTTLRLGGPAGRLVTTADAAETVEAVRVADAAGEDVLILAGGSNVVIADEGFAGTVVLVRSTGISVRRDDEEIFLTVAAGEVFDQLVAFTVDERMAGVECLSGIPGSTGATPIQNVGAYGQEVSETIVAVTAFDRERDQTVQFGPEDCRFAYRDSVFKRNCRYVVLDVTYRLRGSASSAPIRYDQTARRLGVAIGQTAPLAEARQAVLELRRGKGMVLDATDRDTYSVGSFFVNPVLGAEAFAALCTRLATTPPHWPTSNTRVKVSAAWLIEHAGFTRGYGRDGVAISGKHTLALTNTGDGTTAALLDLAGEIQRGVGKFADVWLSVEPVVVGTKF